MSNVVRVYSTQTCPWCRVAKDYLRARGVSFEDVDVGSDGAAAQEMVRLTGQYGVPVIVVNGQPVIGFDRGKLDLLLAS